jgi:hypothetical protein
LSTGKIEDQSPQRESGGEEVRVRQRALREPDGIESGEKRSCGSDRDLAGDAMGETVDRQEAGGGDDQLGEPCGERSEAGDLPPQGEVKGRERRVRIRERAVWNQRAGAEEIVGGRDIVAGLVPVVGEAQQREVGEIEGDKDERKDQPQGEGLVALRIGFVPRGKSEEGDDCCLRGL